MKWIRDLGYLGFFYYRNFNKWCKDLADYRVDLIYKVVTSFLIKVDVFFERVMWGKGYLSLVWGEFIIVDKNIRICICMGI